MSVLLPSLRGRTIPTAGGGGGGPPAIGTQLFSWSADGDFGTMWQDLAQTIPAGIGSRVAALRTAEGAVFTQNDAPQRPILQGAVQNGYEGLYFSNSRNDFLSCTAAAFLASMRSQTALTALLVWKVLVHAGTDTGFYAHTPGSSNGGLHITRTGGGDDTNGARTGTSGVAATYHAAANISAAYATVLTFAGFGGTPKKNTIYVQSSANLTAVNTDAADSLPAWTEFTLGARKPSVGHTDFLTGHLFELLIWDAEANLSSVGNIFTYANTKWGL